MTPNDLIALVHEHERRQAGDLELRLHGTLRAGSDQQGVIDPQSVANAVDALHLFLPGAALLVSDANDFQPIAAVALLQVGEVGDGVQTRDAVSAPEVDEHQSPAMVAVFPGPAANVIERKV